jgi:hypothetical protein
VKYIQLLNLLVDFSIAQGNGTMKMMRSRGGTSITMYANDNYSLGDNMLLQGRCDYCLPADCTEGSPIDRFPAAQTHRGGECPQRAACPPGGRSHLTRRHPGVVAAAERRKYRFGIKKTSEAPLLRTMKETH